MDDVSLSLRIDGTRSVCISPLPKQTYHAAGGKGLGGELGYFIYETDEARPELGINVIGKTASIDAAYRLFEIITGQNGRTA